MPGLTCLLSKRLLWNRRKPGSPFFPDDGLKMTDGAKKAGLKLDGPYSALIIKSNTDESGDLAGIYDKLSQADIHVQESSGIADIYGSYGVILYLKQEDCEKAMTALKA